MKRINQSIFEIVDGMVTNHRPYSAHLDITPIEDGDQLIGYQVAANDWEIFCHRGDTPSAYTADITWAAGDTAQPLTLTDIECELQFIAEN